MSGEDISLIILAIFCIPTFIVLIKGHTDFKDLKCNLCPICSAESVGEQLYDFHDPMNPDIHEYESKDSFIKLTIPSSKNYILKIKAEYNDKFYHYAMRTKLNMTVEHISAIHIYKDETHLHIRSIIIYTGTQAIVLDMEEYELLKLSRIKKIGKVKNHEKKIQAF